MFSEHMHTELSPVSATGKAARNGGLLIHTGPSSPEVPGAGCRSSSALEGSRMHVGPSRRERVENFIKKHGQRWREPTENLRGRCRQGLKGSSQDSPGPVQRKEMVGLPANTTLEGGPSEPPRVDRRALLLQAGIPPVFFIFICSASMFCLSINTGILALSELLFE